MKRMRRKELDATPAPKPVAEKMVTVRVVAPMDYPLPRRNWQQGFNGKWYSIEWTPAAWKRAMLNHVKVTTRIVPERLVPFIEQVQS